MGLLQLAGNGRSTGAAATSRPPIDRAHLARFTFGNGELEREVLGLFAQQAPQTLAALETATTAKAWRDAAHTLKGSARAVGAWEVAGKAELAERAGYSELQPRDAMITEISGLLSEAIAYIQGLGSDA